jgi:tRNA G46 methylase TrmB
LPDDALTNRTAGYFDPRRWFKDPARRFEIEIGCGKGTFILETSQHEPTTNFLGIEWAREYYLYTADRLRRAQAGNVRMLHTDASDFLRWRVTRIESCSTAFSPKCGVYSRLAANCAS